MSSASKVRVAVLFGSGASVPFDLPIQRELLEQMVKQPIGEGNRETFDILMKSGRYGADIEEMLTTLEIANARRDYSTLLYPDDTWGQWELIVGAMSEVVKVTEEKLEKGLSIYRSLVQVLSRTAWGALTLNYDLFLEHVLCRLGQVPDYGLEFDLWRPWPVPRGVHRPVLKLHGSLNWAYCSTCSLLLCSGPHEHPCVRQSFTYKPAWLNGWRWAVQALRTCDVPKCTGSNSDHAVSAVITVPSRIKDLRLHARDIVSRRAARHLLSADIIVLVGCAVREADTDLRYLLHAALAARDAQPAVYAFCSWDTLEHLRDFFQSRTLVVNGVAVTGGEYLTENAVERFRVWLEDATAVVRQS